MKDPLNQVLRGCGLMVGGQRDCHPDHMRRTEEILIWCTDLLSVMGGQDPQTLAWCCLLLHQHENVTPLTAHTTTEDAVCYIKKQANCDSWTFSLPSRPAPLPNIDWLNANHSPTDEVHALLCKLFLDKNSLNNSLRLNSCWNLII